MQYLICLVGSYDGSYIMACVSRAQTPSMMMNCDDLIHVFTVIQETINRLESLSDPSEREGLAIRLEYLNRSLINVSNNSELDEVVSLIERALTELNHETE